MYALYQLYPAAALLLLLLLLFQIWNLSRPRPGAPTSHGSQSTSFLKGGITI
jgi:hypothetical protein